ncbi:MAG: nuclear transport factor 2 family protein [Eubacterium sp.]|nr:nuclear transport factor 2 family protein [Eubacterium sp.]
MNEKELLERIESLEKQVKRNQRAADAVEIQNVMSRYIFYLENGNIAGVWDDLFTHEREDVKMEIMDAGGYIGPEHVKRAYYTMSGLVDLEGNPAPKKSAGMSNTNTDRAALLLMLTISTPMIEVSEDGKEAWGQWHLFGPHSNRVFDPASGNKKDTAFWIAGKYDNEFVKDSDGQWRFKSVRAINWLRTPYDKSWLECADCRSTPSPYYPVDIPRRVTSFNPDGGFDPDRWGPLPHEHVVHN